MRRWFLDMASATQNTVKISLPAQVLVVCPCPARFPWDFKFYNCLFLQRCCSREHKEPKGLQKWQPGLRNFFNPFSTPTACFMLGLKWSPMLSACF